MDYNKILLNTIFNKTGIYITNKNDCRLLSEYIIKDKIGYISESTLYRFFLHSHSNHKPYKNTYNILAQFCGFESWIEFLDYCDINSLFKESNFLNNILDCFVSDLVVKQKFTSLLDFFESMENENFKTKEYVGLKTFINFQKTNTFQLFIEKHGQNSFVRNILMESLYDPFHRINGYTQSYDYYLNFTNPNEENYLQDFIFANAILFRYYYLNKDNKSFEIGKKLYEFPISSLEFDKIHLFPKTRFYAYKIWYLNLINAGEFIQNNYLEYVMNWINENIKSSETIIEINIIYQTFNEVFQKLKLKEVQQKMKSIYEFQIKILEKKNTIDLVKIPHNANGILNILS